MNNTPVNVSRFMRKSDFLSILKYLQKHFGALKSLVSGVALSGYSDKLELSPDDSARLTASFISGAMNGKYVRITTPDDMTITISSPTTNIPVGMEGVIEQTGAGTITFAEGAGATVNNFTGLATGGQYDMIFWKKLSADTFIIHGGS